MRPRDLAALEFPRVCARIGEFAASPAGRNACALLAPTADRDVAERAIERVWQCFQMLERHGDPPLREFADVRGHLRTAAHEGFVLDGPALVEVRATLGAVREVGAFFRRHATSHPALADVPQQLPVFPSLEASLVRALDDEGRVLDQASDELARIRAAIRRLRDTLTRRLEELVARPGLAEVVADDYVTLRNNRFVVPVRAAAIGRMNGVVQDRSISGETLFVEPLFAVDLNNQLLLAVREEEAIVRRILADLTALVRAEHGGIGDAVNALVGVDCLVARVKFARAYRCTRPVFTAAAIELRAARHPGLLFTGRAVTPIDLLLPADKQVLIITGPNTGGKTVALKTLGLCALMAQSGILIPAAEGAQLPCVPAVFTDVGDEQNIERNLSTFSAHIANLCEILASPAHAPLILLDEPGVGTDPEEGAALAVGLIQHCEQLAARVVITTHYAPVKRFALGRPSCLLAAVDFDVERLAPRYRLAYHSLGRSLALPIAQRLGLPESVLAAARAAQSEDSRAFSTAMGELEATRHQLEAELALAAARAAALTAQETESRRVLEELRERRRGAWDDALREARRFLRDTKEEGRALLKDLQGAVEARAQFDRVVRERESAVAAQAAQADLPEIPTAASPASSGPLRAGDTVEVGARGIRGELLSVDGERAWIQRGSLRFEVPAAQLRRVGRATPSAPVQVHVSGGGGDVGREISLIGLRAREAVAELETFLDRAAQARQPRVRIVHGLGSGALRRAVHDYLAGSPYCAEFRAGEGSEGGGGVTVVEMNV